MSFSVDQFMQVKCKLTLTSESESSESEASETIHTNNEQIRLCKSVQMDANNQSTLIVMVCSNEISNNHILAYYIERPQARPHHNHLQQQQQQSPAGNSAQSEQQAGELLGDQQQQIESTEDSKSTGAGPAKLARQTSNPFAPNHQPVCSQSSSPQSAAGSSRPRSRIKPRIIVKQIYYHNYNEDIVAICLNGDGTKLVLINASSTIYLIPIKNILLNLHAQQLRSSQGRSMCFYDASIVRPACAQDTRAWCLNEPVDVVLWDANQYTAATGQQPYDQLQPSVLVIANREGKLTYISLEEKREICSHHVGEPIRSLEIIRDGQSHSLLITCVSFNQYRQSLVNLCARDNTEQQQEIPRPVESQRRASLISLSLSKFKTRLTKAANGLEETKSAGDGDANSSQLANNSKPVLLKLPSAAHQTAGQVEATARVIQQVFTPSASHLRAQSSLSYNEARDRPLVLLGHQPPDLISVFDALGASRSQTSTSPLHYHRQAVQVGVESRLLRFYSSKSYSQHPAARRAQAIYKLDSLDPDELITNLILTERFIAFTTDRERCIINSRNCCRLKSSTSSSSSNPNGQHSLRPSRHVNPLVKEISFNHEERIMLLVKSPICNDQDNIIDSFLLVTTRSIYSIEARHSCRELFINLIDAHLAIKRTLFMSKEQLAGGEGEQSLSSFNLERLVTTSESGAPLAHLNNGQQPAAATSIEANYDAHRNAESKLLINNFLQHRELYEKICHDSLAFSALFKLELPSLYEAYGDRLLQRGQLILANRFYQMASLDHKKILAKYIRVGFIDAKRKESVWKSEGKFNEQQKQIAEDIFIELMTTCLDESTEDSCRLWFNYINFYLSYIASLDELQLDILRMTDTFGDCRLAISLYKAIHRDELLAMKGSVGAETRRLASSQSENGPIEAKLEGVASSFKAVDKSSDPLESMDQIENLAHLFKNEFLMRLLDRTLDLLPQHVDLDALIIATMC